METANSGKPFWAAPSEGKTSHFAGNGVRARLPVVTVYATGLEFRRRSRFFLPGQSSPRSPGQDPPNIHTHVQILNAVEAGTGGPDDPLAKCLNCE